MARASFKLNFGANTRAFSRASRNLTRGLKNIQSSMDKVSQVSGTMLTGMAIGAGAVIKTYSDMQASLIKVKTLLTDKNFKKGIGLDKGYNKLIKEALNLTEKYAVSQEDVGEALFSIQSALGDVNKTIPVLNASMKLSIGGASNLAVATDAMSRAMASYGFKAEEAETIASKFFAGQKDGILDVEQLAEAFIKAGGTASTLGVSIDEVITAISTMTSSGFKAKEAGLALNQAMLHILKPSIEAQKALKQFGIDVEKDWGLALIRSKGLTGALETLNKLWKKDAELTAKIIPDKTTLGKILGLVTNKQQRYKETLAKVKDEKSAIKELDDATITANNIQKAQFTKLINTIKNLAFVIGAELEPGVNKWVQTVQKMISSFKENKEVITSSIQAFKELALILIAVYTTSKIISWTISLTLGMHKLGVAVLSGISSLTKFVFWLGKMAIGLVKGIYQLGLFIAKVVLLGKKKGIVHALSFAFNGLGAKIAVLGKILKALFFTGAPWILAISAVIGLVYLAVKAFEDWELTTIYLKNAFDFAKQGLTSFWSIIKALGRDIKNFLLNPLQTISSGNFFTNIIQAVNNAKGAFQALYRSNIAPAIQDLNTRRSQRAKQNKATGFSMGGLVPSNPADSLMGFLKPGELVIPRQNFNEVVTAVNKQREGNATPQRIVIELEPKGGLEDFYEKMEYHLGFRKDLGVNLS